MSLAGFGHPWFKMLVLSFYVVLLYRKMPLGITPNASTQSIQEDCGVSVWGDN